MHKGKNKELLEQYPCVAKGDEVFQKVKQLALHRSKDALYRNKRESRVYGCRCW